MGRSEIKFDLFLHIASALSLWQHPQVRCKGVIGFKEGSVHSTVVLCPFVVELLVGLSPKLVYLEPKYHLS